MLGSGSISFFIVQAEWQSGEFGHLKWWSLEQSDLNAKQGVECHANGCRLQEWQVSLFFHGLHFSSCQIRRRLWPSKEVKFGCFENRHYTRLSGRGMGRKWDLESPVISLQLCSTSSVVASCQLRIYICGFCGLQ